MTSSARHDFTTALGPGRTIGSYDRMIERMTNELVWRRALLEKPAPGAGETIVDTG
tara:strand:- start:264 stop:431 length:168 start_codon:yes stop_codon:yes gene_type:complete